MTGLIPGEGEKIEDRQFSFRKREAQQMQYKNNKKKENSRNLL